MEDTTTTGGGASAARSPVLAPVDDGVDLVYIAPPGGKRAHVERPGTSFGKGDAWSMLARANRGRQTFCGRPIDETTWQPADDRMIRCGTCLVAEFADD